MDEISQDDDIYLRMGKDMAVVRSVAQKLEIASEIIDQKISYRKVIRSRKIPSQTLIWIVKKVRNHEVMKESGGRPPSLDTQR